jgi:hypothetical protein
MIQQRFSFCGHPKSAENIAYSEGRERCRECNRKAAKTHQARIRHEAEMFRQLRDTIFEMADSA